MQEIITIVNNIKELRTKGENINKHYLNEYRDLLRTPYPELIPRLKEELSENFFNDKQKLFTEEKEKVETILQAVIQSVKDKYSETMKADDLATIQAWKLADNVPHTEIEALVERFKFSPLAMKIVQDIAVKNNYHNPIQSNLAVFGLHDFLTAIDDFKGTCATAVNFVSFGVFANNFLELQVYSADPQKKLMNQQAIDSTIENLVRNSNKLQSMLETIQL